MPFDRKFYPGTMIGSVDQGEPIYLAFIAKTQNEEDRDQEITDYLLRIESLLRNPIPDIIEATNNTEEIWFSAVRIGLQIPNVHSKTPRITMSNTSECRIAAFREAVTVTLQPDCTTYRTIKPNSRQSKPGESRKFVGL